MYSLSKELRFLYWFIVGLCIPFSYTLYIDSWNTQYFWAWDISHPRSAMLIGAGYIGFLAYILFLLKDNDWRKAESGQIGMWITSVLFLLAALIHTGQVRLLHFTTFLWTIQILTILIGVPLTIRIQKNRMRSFTGDTDVSQAGGRRMSEAWHTWLMVRGFFYAAVVLIWFCAAPIIIEKWPWSIQSFDLRIFSAQMASIAWLSVVALKAGSQFFKHSAGLFLSFVTGIAQLTGLLFGPDVYNVNCGFGLFLPIMFAEWVFTPIFIWFTRGKTASMQLASG